jgi:hypothetical protein
VVGLYCRNAIENNWFYWFVRMPFGSVEGVRTMTTEAIIAVGVLIVIAMAWSAPVSHDYHTDLKNIAYQLSRIADALDRSNNNDQS